MPATQGVYIILREPTNDPVNGYWYRTEDEANEAIKRIYAKIGGVYRIKSMLRFRNIPDCLDYEV